MTAYSSKGHKLPAAAKCTKFGSRYVGYLEANLGKVGNEAQASQFGRGWIYAEFIDRNSFGSAKRLLTV